MAATPPESPIPSLVTPIKSTGSHPLSSDEDTLGSDSSEQDDSEDFIKGQYRMRAVLEEDEDTVYEHSAQSKAAVVLRSAGEEHTLRRRLSDVVSDKGPQAIHLGSAAHTSQITAGCIFGGIAAAVDSMSAEIEFEDADDMDDTMWKLSLEIDAEAGAQKLNTRCVGCIPHSLT